MIEIQLANEGHIPALLKIELKAAEIFSEADLPAPLRTETVLFEEHLDAVHNGLLFVALEDDALPVGFAITKKIGSYLHLLELDVDPRMQRQGIGTSLLEGVMEMATNRGFQWVTLTTFRHLPWNAPWYRKFGFRILDVGEIQPFLKKILEEEKAKGLNPLNRVAMCKMLNSG